MLGRNIAADGNATERTEVEMEGGEEREVNEGGRGFRGRRSIRSLLRHSTIATKGGSTLRSVREIEGGDRKIVFGDDENAPNEREEIAQSAAS